MSRNRDPNHEQAFYQISDYKLRYNNTNNFLNKATFFPFSYLFFDSHIDMCSFSMIYQTTILSEDLRKSTLIFSKFHKKSSSKMIKYSSETESVNMNSIKKQFNKNVTASKLFSPWLFPICMIRNQPELFYIRSF